VIILTPLRRGFLMRTIMEVRKLQCIDEMEICVDLYIKYNDESFIPASRKRSVERFIELVKSGAFLRVIEEDGKIMAWILAARSKFEHVDQMVFQQLYFGSDFKGLKAAKAVKILHEALIEEAVRLNVPRVFSMGNPLDEKNVFTRILEKSGWDRRGFVASKLVLKPRR